MYEEAEIDMTPQKLMGLALTKFHTLKEQLKWTQNENASEEIVSLKAEIASLKQQNKRKWEQTKQSKKKDERFAWKEKKIAGKDVLLRNNKTYQWCPFHKAYTLHRPDECRLDPKKQKADKRNEETPIVDMAAIYNEEAELNTFGDEMVCDEDE